MSVVKPKPPNDAADFELLPAIDLRSGRVVRLREGDFGRETVYGDDPVAVARRFADAGARWLHIVDLDGARDGVERQADAIRSIVDAVGERVACEVAGGLRDIDAVGRALEAGARRVVVGTAALRDPGFAARLVATHGPDRIVVALDIRNELALGDGWRRDAPGIPVLTVLDSLVAAGIVVFEVTATSRDGTLAGPDRGLLGRLASRDAIKVIAAGGIATIEDLLAVRSLGCTGAIVGRALYEGRFRLGAALAALHGDGSDDEA
jgi:phosphoribosylformimino-5-aminoimidazole carboxamide ribotide isomerase